MIFSALRKEDLKTAALFLQQYEPLCISLIQSLIHKNARFYILKNENPDGKKECITGIISIFKGETVMHCLPDTAMPDEVKCQIAYELAKYPLFCINGEMHGTDFLISLLKKYNGKTIQTKNTYNLMTKCKSRNPIEKKPMLSIKQCKKNDVTNLLPLELSYQEEEVLPAGHHADPKVYNYTLSKQMETQFIFCASDSSGMPVAKAATNALSWNWAQLGGVYTVPEQRRNGFAYALVEHISEFLLKQNRYCALFVNTKNTAANNLYKKCGFLPLTSYCIAYYS